MSESFSYTSEEAHNRSKNIERARPPAPWSEDWEGPVTHCRREFGGLRGKWRGAFATAAALLLLPGTAAAQCTSATTAGVAEPNQLFMADGQLISSPVRIFVNKVITPDQIPQLRLYGGHAITAEHAAERQAFAPITVLPYQSEIVAIDGANSAAVCGTILYFDLRSYPVEWYKPMRRVIAVVSWRQLGSGAQEQRAAPPSPVNLGQPTAAWGWTVLVVMGLASGVWKLAYPAGQQIRRFWATTRWWLGRTLRPAVPRTPPAPIQIGSRPAVPFCLLCSDDGHLSLSKVQITLWTLAIATTVFFYGLVRIEVPSIPSSLIAVMGVTCKTLGGSRCVASDAGAACDGGR